VGRIRLFFVLLAVLLLAPMGLLVQRALDSVAFERQVSHRAVAERLFDEMERELSQLLRGEEERPFADYRFQAPDEDANGDGSAPRPPRAGSDPPYVIGYFQIDPDGTFSAPSSAVTPGRTARVDGDEREAVTREAGGARVAAPTEPPQTLLEEAVAQGLRGAGEPDRDSGAGVGVAQSPGTTLELKKSDGWKQQASAASDAVAEAEAEYDVSLFGVLQSLNKGASGRRERQARSRSALPPRATADPQASPPIASEAPAAPTTAGGSLRPLPAAESVALARELGLAGTEGAVADRYASVDKRASGEPSLEVQPMVGRLIDARRLLLIRTVLFGEQVYRQGLVVDVPALFRRLDEAVVGDGRLAAFVDRDFFTLAGDGPPSADPDGFRYIHRFAEPFDSLAVRLVLDPLPDVGGAGYLYAIAALLLISGSLGLFALYRMVAVRVRFAERRNNFVAAVSHELKTPLTAIRMYAEMLRDGMVQEEAKRREYYGTITAESERLTRLINNVLEFSRLEQGTRDVNLVVGSLGPVVIEAAELLRPHAREVGFEIDVLVEEGLPPVRFDRDAVLQVVFNLVDNALKYSRHAANRRITIRCGRVGGAVALTVSDRGPGVAPHHLSKIFEAFYRGEDELTRTAKGTGIGLALVRGLAESMGAGVSGRNLGEGGFEVALTFRFAASS